jgi:hypothetical protein
MPRFEFNQDHVDPTHPRQRRVFKAQGTYLISQKLADELLAAQKGQVVSSPGQEEAPAETEAAAAPAGSKRKKSDG